MCQLDPYAEHAIQLLNAAPCKDTATVGRKSTVPKHTRDHPYANVQTERVSHANNAEATALCITVRELFSVFSLVNGELLRNHLQT